MVDKKECLHCGNPVEFSCDDICSYCFMLYQLEAKENWEM